MTAEPRPLRVLHRTVYRYASPVTRSSHLLRLVPVHDHRQSLLEHELVIALDGEPLASGHGAEHEDVFGNRARRVEIERPYRELAIEARSRVAPLDADPSAAGGPRARATIPFPWMPWQRQVLQPFLLPPELPESELLQLTDYATSFVHRNDADLVWTLLDMNRTISREYEYRQGATSLVTTAFEAYAKRHGVCQDFANLLICLARLLGVPARYVCGYVYTGPESANVRQSEASHAWAEVYVPDAGWAGLDPTNGVLALTDHVRVAVGRGYVDATPTSGTIFSGGGGETLDVDVRVERAAPGTR
jgi:transglutaminase-like putative cysteine protease